MAAGELVSVRAQHELMERELRVERGGAGRGARGRAAGAGRHVSGSGRAARTTPTRWPASSAANASLALDTHARLELGIDPDASGVGRECGRRRPSWPSRVGALLPLLPWFFTGGTAARGASIIIGAVAALVLGAVIGVLTERGVARTALRQLAVVTVAAGVTYAVGSLLGVSTS